MNKAKPSVLALTVDPIATPVRAVQPDARSARQTNWPAITAVTMLWLSLFWVLSTDWSTNSQYSYGWLVPFLGLVVFWERWRSRPLPEPDHVVTKALLVSLALLLLALPIRLFEEANPEWRFILWLHAGWVAASCLWLVSYAGGGKWVRHFGFAFVFPLISVPLPSVLENTIIQNLTRLVTLVTTELANLTGIPAFQHGNLIEIGTGILGVEEACSGIRSLQSSLLIALFLGEFYRLTGARRVGLVLSGFLIAILSNIGRTYVLVHAAAHSGLLASQRLHDRVATIAMITAVGLIFLAAQWLRRRHPVPDPVPSSKPEGILTSRPVPRWFWMGALTWLVLVGVSVELWYWSHERNVIPNARWTVRKPSPADGLQAITIPDRSRAMLRYSTGHGLAWRDGANFQWRLYYLRWEAGRNSAQLAKAHTPEICLSASGGELKERLGQHTFELPTTQLSFDQYVFEFAGQPLHVFYCLAEDQRGVPGKDLPEDGTQQSRLAAVLAGKRHLGQTVIEAAVRGPAAAEEARALFAAELKRLVLP